MKTLHKVMISEGDLITDKFLKLILNHIMVNHEKEYKKEIQFQSPMADTLVYKICKGDQELSITRYGQTDDRMEIQGDKEFILEFLSDLAIEASTLIAKSLCMNVINDDNEQDFVNILQNKIKEAIDLSFKEYLSI